MQKPVHFFSYSFIIYKNDGYFVFTKFLYKEAVMLPFGTDKQTVSYEHVLHSGRIEEQIKKIFYLKFIASFHLNFG